MNTQNLEFLKNSLLNLGFGETLNLALQKNIEKKVPEFTLDTKHNFNQRQVDYTLHFKAGNDLYFLNKFDAKLNKGQETEQQQTFYINKGHGITAKEAFNLMEGRAVHKTLFNKEGEKYQAWLQFDNNKEFKRFTENYGFNLEKVLTGKGIIEMNTTEGRDTLLRSLRKGNAQQVTVDKNGEEKKYFISASPQFKTFDLFDVQMKKLKREELLPKQDQQQKEALPEKKQRGKKIAV